MRAFHLLKFVLALLLLAGCAQQPTVVDYPPLDWSVNGQRLKDTGCAGDLREDCPELAALGCDAIETPGFFLGGLQPPLAVMECVHEVSEPPDREHFKQPPGLDTRYRSYVVIQDGTYRLIINRSEFKQIFAPVESSDEALSYAMAMTSLGARFDIDPAAKVEYLADRIEETHVEETPDGYLVTLFDWSHKMGCDTHPFYSVKVLVTPQGDVREVERQEIYTSQACFDFEGLSFNPE